MLSQLVLPHYPPGVSNLDRSRLLFFLLTLSPPLSISNSQENFSVIKWMPMPTFLLAPVTWMLIPTSRFWSIARPSIRASILKTFHIPQTRRHVHENRNYQQSVWPTCSCWPSLPSGERLTRELGSFTGCGGLRPSSATAESQQPKDWPKVAFLTSWNLAGCAQSA